MERHCPNCEKTIRLTDDGYCKECGVHADKMDELNAYRDIARCDKGTNEKWLEKFGSEHELKQNSSFKYAIETLEIELNKHKSVYREAEKAFLKNQDDISDFAMKESKGYITELEEAIRILQSSDSIAVKLANTLKTKTHEHTRR